MTTDQVGSITEAALLEKGYTVLVPWGGGLAYDLAVEIDGVIRKVQCKTGRIVGSVVSFHERSSHRKYGNDIEYFGVYCQRNGKTYLVPAPGRSLRLEPTRNGQSKGVWFAKDFEL